MLRFRREIGEQVVLGGEFHPGDEKLPIFRAVGVVNGVIPEFEPGAGNEVTHRAFTVEGLAGEIPGLLAQGGIARHLVGVAAVVAGLRVVVFEAVGQRAALFAVIHPRLVFTDGGRHRLIVVARKGRPAGLDLPFGGPGVDGVVGFDAVGAVEADRGVVRMSGRRVIVAVEEDQGVLREGVGLARGCRVFFADPARARRIGPRGDSGC